MRKDDVAFGELIRHIRNEHGLTQNKMAEQAELSLRQYQNIESNVQLPGYNALKSLTQNLRINPVDLFYERDDTQQGKIEDIQFLLSQCTEQQLNMIIAMIRTMFNMEQE